MGNEIKVTMRKLAELVPYENNPRDNSKAVNAVAESIKEFGFKNPIIVDKNSCIVAGHTRLKAAEKLGLDEVPVIVADDLSDEQVKAFRLADNKTAELAEWNFELLDAELAEICAVDMSAFGKWGGENTFTAFDERDRNDREKQEGNDEYNAFVEKFEIKKTTDDCYTPDGVYKVVADYVAEQYGLKQENFVRPFYPGGDYQKEKYKASDVVVDNPPFSILAEILSYYKEQGVKFFLFAPTLTLFSSSSSSCALPCGVAVTYENGANVNTSFLTNLEEENLRFRTCPTLYEVVQKANDEWLKEQKKELPKYSYPDEVVTSANIARFSKYGVNFKALKSETVGVSALDAQKEVGKTIYGKGYLLSEKAAAEKAAAEKAAAEKAAAKRWELSERERAIVKSLG